MPTPVRLLPLALLALAACSSKDDGGDDAGTPAVVDLCNSREEALTRAECELKPGETLERFLALEGDVKAGDQDWYRIVVPASSTARTLVNVNGAYVAASTAVNLSVTVLETLENGTDKAIVKKADMHGQGQPQPVDMVIPLRADQAGKTLLVLVQDSPTVTTRPNYDARSPYRLTLAISENPDVNEPNDVTPTALTLTANEATATGYLATDGDVDRFSFDLPAGKIAYVNVTAPDQSFAPNWRLSYELLRPGGTERESEGMVPPKVHPGVLATARKIKTAGRWTLVVKGYQPSNSTETPPGDLRQPYQVLVRVLDEQDTYDAAATNNDSASTAVVGNLTAPGGAPVSFTGRLAYVPDRDWYQVRVPASTVPTVLRYKVSPQSAGGRFPALPGDVDRQVSVVTLVTTGANVSEWRAACLNNVAACPKGYGENPDARALVETYCSRTDLPAPMCLWSTREEPLENPRFTGLSNFQGALPVAPHTGTLTYYFLIQDDGNDWADDKDYTLQVSWEAEDADEQGRYSGGVEQPVARTLASTTAFPAPPDTAEFSVSGEMSYGYGRLAVTDRINGLGVRGPTDYDAVPSDVDSYTFQLPSVAAPEDRTWLVQWEVANLADGGAPHGLALDLTFCNGDSPDAGTGTCVPVTTGSRGGGLTLAYRADALRAWHSPSTGTSSSLQPLYTLDKRPSSTVVTLAPYACGCLERRFIRGGSMKVDVAATQRTDYERVTYTLRTGYGDYPKSYATDGGGSATCPAPYQDGGTVLADGGTTPLVWAGGCAFTLQP